MFVSFLLYFDFLFVYCLVGWTPQMKLVLFCGLSLLPKMGYPQRIELRRMGTLDSAEALLDFDWGGPFSWGIYTTFRNTP